MSRTTAPIPAPDVAAMIDAIATDLARLRLPRPIMIGIHTGGVWVARRLHEANAVVFQAAKSMLRRALEI